MTMILFTSLTTSGAPSEGKEAIRDMIQNMIQRNEVVFFSATYCNYCVKAKDLLLSLRQSIKVIEIDLDPNYRLIRKILEQITHQTTVPNIFIYGQHIGGCEDLYALYHHGILEAILKDGKANFGDKRYTA